MEDRSWLTVAETAQALGVTREAIYYAINAGTLEARWITPSLRGIEKEEVEKYRKNHLGRKGWRRRREQKAEQKKEEE